MKVCVFRSTDGACDYYRSILPIQTAELNGEMVKKELWIQNILVSSRDQSRFVDAIDSDIFLIQNISGSPFIGKLRDFSKEAKINAKFVMDYDDDIFNVSPFSNHYVTSGTQEAKIFNQGQLIHEWKDGINIDIKANQKKIDDVKRSCESVDLITTTTEHLAKVYRQYNDNVKILPNCVDLTEWNKLDINRNKDEIRIAWAGGHSHWEDLYMIRDVLKEIGSKYPVKIFMLGYMPASMPKDFKEGQLQFMKWVELPAHPYRLASLDIDIAVIPLKDTPFNRSKSPIKWIEFSALEIPCVTSLVPPYDSLCIENGIFIEHNDTQGWVQGIEALIKDRHLREMMGSNARQYVKDNFDINTQYKQWVNAFEEVKCQSLPTPR